MCILSIHTYYENTKIIYDKDISSEPIIQGFYGITNPQRN